MSVITTLVAGLAAASMSLTTAGAPAQDTVDEGSAATTGVSVESAPVTLTADSLRGGQLTLDDDALEEMFGHHGVVSVDGTGVTVSDGGHTALWLSWKQWGCIFAIAGYVGTSAGAIASLFLTGGMSVPAVLAMYGIASAGVVTACYNSDGSPVF